MGENPLTSFPGWPAVEQAIQDLIGQIIADVDQLFAGAPPLLQPFIDAAEEKLKELLGAAAGTALHLALSQLLKDAVAAKFSGPNTFDSTSMGG